MIEISHVRPSDAQTTRSVELLHLFKVTAFSGVKRCDLMIQGPGSSNWKEERINAVTSLNAVAMPRPLTCKHQTLFCSSTHY